jgi:hypothetical protein
MAEIRERRDEAPDQSQLEWYRPCNNGDCVEMATLGTGRIALRGSLDGGKGPVLVLQRLAKQGDSEGLGEPLVTKGKESRTACHLIGRGSVSAYEVTAFARSV